MNSRSLMRPAVTGTVLADLRVLVALHLAVASMAAAGTAQAADGELPDSAFLEYLGSWDEDDEEWWTVAERAVSDADASDAVKRQDERDKDEQES